MSDDTTRGMWVSPGGGVSRVSGVSTALWVFSALLCPDNNSCALARFFGTVFAMFR